MDKIVFIFVDNPKHSSNRCRMPSKLCKHRKKNHKFKNNIHKIISHNNDTKKHKKNTRMATDRTKSLPVSLFVQLLHSNKRKKYSDFQRSVKMYTQKYSREKCSSHCHIQKYTTRPTNKACSLNGFCVAWKID